MSDIIINNYSDCDCECCKKGECSCDIPSCTCHEDLKVVNHKLDKILFILKGLSRMEEIMTQALVNLEAAVQENTSLDDSIVTLVEGLAAQIAELKDDPAKLQALADSLVAKSQKMKDAILANTPAEPEPTPVA
jgi:hypothetical protein